MKKTNTIVAVMLVAALALFALVGCNMTPFAVSICEKTDDGTAVLNATLLELNEYGINIGDKVQVSVGGFSEELVLVDELVEEDGKTQFFCDTENGSINILIYNGDFMETNDIAVGDMVKLWKK